MNIRAILVPYDSGRCSERMGRGPRHLLDSAVQPTLTRLGHNLTVEEITLDDPHPAEIKTAFALCREVAARVRDGLREGCFPLVLSGNCNIAVGTVTGCGCATTSVLWFDAHGEATTPDTTTSGFLDGMGISILTGECWRSLTQSIPQFAPVAGENIFLLGARDLEPAETELLARAGVRRAEAVPSAPFYLHLDLDVLDPTEAVTNQWPTPGGMTVASLIDSVNRARSSQPLKALGIASYDPAADHDARGVQAVVRLLQALFP
jgi:arginase